MTDEIETPDDDVPDDHGPENDGPRTEPLPETLPDADAGDEQDGEPATPEEDKP